MLPSTRGLQLELVVQDMAAYRAISIAAAEQQQPHGTALLG
jgi:hypothetical protein